jgi:hypothetical protein
MKTFVPAVHGEVALLVLDENGRSEIGRQLIE